MTTITYGSSVKETAKSRRHARRRAAAIERDNLEGVIDAAFGVKTLSLDEKHMKAQQRVKAARKAAVIASGCSSLKVARAINCEDYGLQIARATKRIEKEFNRIPVIDGPICIPDVALYAAGYRKSESVTAR